MMSRSRLHSAASTPRVADVLHQDARAHALEALVAQPCQRHAQHRDVVAARQRGARPGTVVDEIAARGDLGQITRVGLGVQRHHDVDAAVPGAMRVARHADLVPGGQPLDVGGKVVLAHHGHAAAEDRLHQQSIGARRAGAVHRGDLDHEIVGTVSDSVARHEVLLRASISARGAASAASTSACPRRRSDSARRTVRSARRGFRP